MRKTGTFDRDLHEFVNNLTPSTSQTVKKVYKKVGRNDKCPCGSGKKYKQCCLKKLKK